MMSMADVDVVSETISLLVVGSTMTKPLIVMEEKLPLKVVVLTWTP